MSYDTWKCAPPDEELEMEACGHTIGTCVCDPAETRARLGECP